MLSTPGIPFGNGDLPYIEVSLYSFKKFWTWNEFGSYHGLETLPRYPIIAAFQIVNISPDISSKLLIVGGFAIASFSFYFSCLKFFKNRIDIENIKFKAAALLGSLFYAYNVWSFHRVGHWYFWLGYAILPIFFVSVIYAFRNPRKWKYILVSVLLWSVASSTPHMAVFFAIIFVGLAIIFILKNVRRNRTKLKTILLKPISLTIVAYIFINLYWIYPYLVSSTSESFLWSAVVTEEITRELSRESDFLSVLRLIEGTFNMGIIDVTPDQTSKLYSIWSFTSFVPPVLAFSSVLFLKRKNAFGKYILFFCALAIIGILLTMGSNAPFDVYSTLLFHTPLTSYLQILLREPDKWGFLVAFAYSFLIVISCSKILDKLKSNNYKRLNFRNVLSTCFILFFLVSVATYIYPAYRDSMYDLYRPIVLPDDFSNLRNNLNKVVNNKVFLTPYSPGNTTWVKNIGTFELYHVASPVPNIAAYDYNTVEKYHKYLIDSIITNKTTDIEDIVYPLGTSYILFHNDTLTAQSKELLNTLMSKMDRVSLVNDFGFFKLFKIGNNQTKIQPVNIPFYNALITGGLDKFASLNSVPSFSTQNSTLFFLDQKIKNVNDKPILDTAKYAFLSPNANDFILSFIDAKQLVEPFQATNNHEPGRRWSKAGSDDPGNAWFTPYMEDLGMQNSDFDYGKGLVITQAIGAKLSMPIGVEETGHHELFMRFLTSQKGGILRVYLDNSPLGEINSRDDRSSNNFVWQKIGSSSSSSLYLSKGKHTLTIENVAGFNAVNLFAILPSEHKARLQENAYVIANKTKNIYILEAESTFHNNKGKGNNYRNGNSNSTGDMNNGFLENKFNGTSGQLQIPQTNDLVSFIVFTNATSQQPITALKMSETSQTVELFESDFDGEDKRNIFGENLENKKESRLLATLRGITQKEIPWVEEEEGEADLSRITTDQGRQIPGKENITIDLRKGHSVNWNVISTEFIEINNGTKSIELGLSISAKDVNQLHPKIVYYDENKKRIKSDFIFGGRDGTFKENITNVYILPQATEHIKLQIFSRPNTEKNSSYTIDNVTITRLVANGLENSNELSYTLIDQANPISGNGSFRADLKKGGSQNWNIISTDFIPVKDSSYYNVSMDIRAKDVMQLHPKIIYYDENKRRITNLNNEEVEEIVFVGLDGNFKKHYKSSPLLPLGTKYIKLQLFAHSNPAKSSSYWLDNIKVKEVNPYSGAVLKYALVGNEDANAVDYNERVENFSGKSNEGVLKESDNSKDQNGRIMIQKTKPIPVKENGIYNYSIHFEDKKDTREVFDVEGSRIDQRSLVMTPNSSVVIAYFANSSDVTQNSTKYGAKASSGSVLSLDPDSEIFTDLDILKPANYNIALRVGSQNNESTNICNSISNGSCQISNSNSPNGPKEVPSLTVRIVQKEQDDIRQSKETENGNKLVSRSVIRLDVDSQQPEDMLGWAYLNNTFLESGKYEIRIRSNSHADLDSVIVYSVDDNQNETLDELFDLGGQDLPANLMGFKKINPTKYEVDIKNASDPFIITFAESYDPLWIAYASKDKELNGNSNNGINSNFSTHSIPMYSIVNGFYINKTGDYTLTVEYQPQEWFVQAGIVSIISLITFVAIVILQENKLNLRTFKHP